MPKCFCGAEIPVFGCVLWCDDCITEFLASGEEMGKFIERKKNSLSDQ